jgi:hypothetical protein
MKPRSLVIALAVIALAPSPPLHAWNSIGHLAVSKLAYDDLDDGLKAKLFGILKSHPHYEQFLAVGRPASVSEVEWAILRSSVWPDWVRPRGKADPRGPDVVKHHRGEDHYINRPFVDPKDAKWAAKRKLIDPDQANILSALQQRCNDLKTKTAADADRAVAACWIFHLVGDIHQPLHNVAYFSDTKAFYKGDMGGNLFGVRVNGQKIKLHMYWDNLLGDDPNYADDSALHQAKVFAEAVKIAAGLRSLKLTEAHLEQLEKNTTFASWSNESLELVRTISYQKADGSGLLHGVLVPFSGNVPDGAVEAGPDYHERARATAEVRVVLAGKRLAERVRLLLK